MEPGKSQWKQVLLGLVILAGLGIVVYEAVSFKSGPSNQVSMPSAAVQQASIDKALDQIALTPAVPARSIAMSQIGQAIEKVGTPAQKLRYTKLMAASTLSPASVAPSGMGTPKPRTSNP